MEHWAEIDYVTNTIMTNVLHQIEFSRHFSITE